jgi:hypothetical protein
MTTYNFDYNIFYNYYTDTNNLLIDPPNNNIIYYFYNEPGPRSQKEIPVPHPLNYITINNGTKVYITELSNKQLLFTLPTLINNKLWSNHYSFGTEIFEYRKSKKQVLMVFFHKTTQDPNKNGKIPNRCYFEDGTLITDVEKIICQQETKSQMDTKFLINDISFIKEIINRPFLGIVNFGGSKSKKLYKGHLYKINIGKRGGKYININGNKKYI